MRPGASREEPVSSNSEGYGGIHSARGVRKVTLLRPNPAVEVTTATFASPPNFSPFVLIPGPRLHLLLFSFYGVTFGMFAQAISASILCPRPANTLPLFTLPLTFAPPLDVSLFWKCWVTEPMFRLYFYVIRETVFAEFAKIRCNRLFSVALIYYSEFN